MMTLVASALAGGDCIDAADVLRTGGTACTLGGTVKAPSTLGTFLRSFRWGHVRQLDRVSRQLLARAWAAGAGPGDSPLTIDLDSTICETYGLAKEGARHHGYTGARGYHPLLAIAAGTGEVLMSRLREGRANTARGAVHPVGNGSPVLLRYRLDQVPQAFVLADGDGEADIHLTTGGDESVGVEAAVGPHRKLPAGPGTANPAHRFTQEVGGAPSGVGAALAQPGHQHLASAGGDGQQRVIAPLAGIAVVACPLLGQSVGLADGGVQVNGQGPVAGSRPGLPRPGQQLAAHPVELTDVAPPEAAQEGAQGGWRLDRAAQGAGRPPGAQHIGVVNAVAPSQRGGHQRHHLVARVRPPRGIAQVEALLDEFGQAEMPGQGGRKEQPGVGHQSAVVEGDLDPVGVVA